MSIHIDRQVHRQHKPSLQKAETPLAGGVPEQIQNTSTVIVGQSRPEHNEAKQVRPRVLTSPISLDGRFSDQGGANGA